MTVTFDNIYFGGSGLNMLMIKPESKKKTLLPKSTEVKIVRQ